MEGLWVTKQEETFDLGEWLKDKFLLYKRATHQPFYITFHVDEGGLIRVMDVKIDWSELEEQPPPPEKMPYVG